MKQLNFFIQEKLKINSQSKVNKYKYYPTNYEQLKDIIAKKINEKGDNINFNDVDVSNLAYMAGAFSYKSNLTHIDISDWDVSNCKDMEEMFIGCKNLESIGDISDWNTSKLEDVTGMFYGCEKLQNIGNLDKWNHSKINRKQNMFDLADKIKKPSWY